MRPGQLFLLAMVGAIAAEMIRPLVSRVSGGML